MDSFYSAKEFQSFFAKSNQSLVIKANPPHFTILAVSDHFLQTSNGRTREGLLGKDFFEVFPVREHNRGGSERSQQKFAEVMRTKTLAETPVNQYEITDPVSGNKQYYYWSARYEPLLDAEGNVAYIIITAANITEQVKKRHDEEKTLRDAEERLRLAVDAGKLGTWDMDLKTSILIHNQRLAELLGYPEGKQLKHSEVRSNILAEDVKIVEAAFDYAMEAGPFIYEVRVKMMDDGIRWVRAMGEVLFDENHEPLRMLGTLIDITERAEVEQRMNEINERLEQEIRKFEIVTDFSPQIIWSATPDGVIDFVNQGWADFTGLSKEDAMANNWNSVIHPDDFETVQNAWINSLREASGYQIEYRLKKHNGEFHWHLERGKPMLDNEGKIIKWFGATVNINDHIELQKQKDNFLGIASHELKTPVTSIKAYTQVLEVMLRKDGDDAKATVVAKIDKQVNRLTNLIADLLDVTKIQGGRLQFNDNYFDFTAMLDDVVDDLQRTTLRHTICKEYDFDGLVFGDRERISQVIVNLVTNAVKYSPGAERIIVRTSKKDNTIEVCVQDFGIGISPDKKDRVFEQFYRVNGTKQHTFPGLGLGLYISSEIIKNQGGRIWVDSAEGEGSSFYFALPVDRTVHQD